MGMLTNVVCWTPLLTDHQSHTFQALVKAENIRLDVYVMRRQDALRTAQGWTETNVRDVEIRLIPNKSRLRYSVNKLRETCNSIHIFASPFENKWMMLILFLATRMGLRVFLISESYATEAVGYLQEGNKFINLIKSLLRPLIYKMYGILYRKHIEGVFAISPLAVQQYMAIGFKEDRVFPFGYFVPALNEHVIAKAPSLNTGICKIIFVGNLITTKGVDLIIEAAKKLYNSKVGVKIDVFGHGNPNDFNFDNAYIEYKGSINFGYAQKEIANYDFLVLPSRYDGWGVVVNEALLAGVPVLCSNRVGAGAIVKRWGCGSVYRIDIPDALYDLLSQLARDSAMRGEMKSAALLVRTRLLPHVAADYMARAIVSCSSNLPKPKNPWY